MLCVLCHLLNKGLKVKTGYTKATDCPLILKASSIPTAYTRHSNPIGQVQYSQSMTDPLGTISSKLFNFLFVVLFGSIH